MQSLFFNEIKSDQIQYLPIENFTLPSLFSLFEKALESISTFIEKPHTYTLLTHLAAFGCIYSICGFTSLTAPLFLTIAVVSNYYKKESATIEKTNQLLLQEQASIEKMNALLKKQIAEQSSSFQKTKELLKQQEQALKEDSEKTHALLIEQKADLQALKESNTDLGIFLKDCREALQKGVAPTVTKALEDALSGSIEKYGTLRTLSEENFHSILLVFNQMRLLGLETHGMVKDLHGAVFDK